MLKQGTIALITTPEYRKRSGDKLFDFVRENLYFLCRNFNVPATGGTYDEIRAFIEHEPSDEELAVICNSLDLDPSRGALDSWRNTIIGGLQKFPGGVKGMILMTHELVEKRIDAVIHLTDWADVTAKADSMVLRREANVHDVHIASDLNSARYATREWGARIKKNIPVFEKRTPPDFLPLQGLTSEHRVLALVAHDQMKLAMCCFVVEHARQIFKQFNYVLATGTTGNWIKKFLAAAGRPKEEVERVRCCRSGPEGGDVQIAAAVVNNLCHSIVFLQDPFNAHAHETDIRLFEQSVLLFEEAGRNANVKLATNLESAKMIFDAE